MIEVKMPIRVQRKRMKGWRKPPNTVYVGRGSAWGNPFVVGEKGMTAQQCVVAYANWLLPYRHHGKNSGMDKFYASIAQLEGLQHELRGKNLMCWCPLCCLQCGGTGLKHSAALLALHPINPPLLESACQNCGGTGKQPCHADWLLETANEEIFRGTE